MLSAIDPTEAIGCDVAFVAVPSGHSQAIVASLVGKVGLIVDLGADFRLKDPAAYEQWYHFTHQQPELLAEAVAEVAHESPPAERVRSVRRARLTRFRTTASEHCRSRAMSS